MEESRGRPAGLDHRKGDVPHGPETMGSFDSNSRGYEVVQ